MTDVLVVSALWACGFFFGRFLLGPIVWYVLLSRRRLDECVDEAFESAPREPCVDRAAVDQIFADMTAELADLRGQPAQLSAYYLRKEEHG